MEATRIEELELASREALRQRKVELVTIKKDKPGIDDYSYLTGFMDGGRYCEDNPIEAIESPSERAWELSKEYITDRNRQHPLSYYFDKAMTEQRNRDKEEFDKRFNNWASKVFEKCVLICSTYVNKAPGDKVEVNIEELITELKGIELD